MNLDKLQLSPLQRIILTTDGSITTVLEALFGEVMVETRLQKLARANRRMARLLGIERGEEVNVREVSLNSMHRALVYAVSLTPIGRIEESFREEIMKEDVPIGRILKKLKIEYRREIRDYSAVGAGKNIAQALGLNRNELLLRRNYHIFREGKVMMNITEFFPYRLFGDATPTPSP